MSTGSNRLIGALALGSIALTPLVGCESLPGNEEEQGAVLGGVAGAAAGAAIAENRVLGALLGGALGAGGGYLIGANWDRITGEDDDDAIAAVERAQDNPATVDDVRGSVTADLNDDGFVTLDEIVAMENAGLSDDEIIRRARATGQIFDLNQDQENFLTARGVSPRVVEELGDINREQKEQLLSERQMGDQVIGR